MASLTDVHLRHSIAALLLVAAISMTIVTTDIATLPAEAVELTKYVVPPTPPYVPST